MKDGRREARKKGEGGGKGRRPNNHSRTSQLAAKAPAAVSGTAWTDEELPLLRLRVTDFSRLPFITLIIAVVDHDTVGQDDQMGTVLVPLSPPDFVPSEGVPQEYRIDVDTSITRGNCSKGLGRMKASLTVSFGEKLQTALEEAMVARAGSLASNMSEKEKACACACM